ncbi:MAG: hypothetical protein HY886_01125 [Deltaproteobacteria bacterium]|nr:hypothetical protein [Deltaproteobacteria bacterium]
MLRLNGFIVFMSFFPLAIGFLIYCIWSGESRDSPERGNLDASAQAS